MIFPDRAFDPETDPETLTDDEVERRKAFIKYVLAPYGRVLPRGTVVKVGPLFAAHNRDLPDIPTYACGAGIEKNASLPVVIVSDKSGQIFVVNWADLITLARERGIETPVIAAPSNTVELPSKSVEPKKRLIL